MTTYAEHLEYVEAKVGFLNLSDLKKLGWTDASIRAILGDCDKSTQNPYSKWAADVRLYREDRVAVAQASPEFAIWRERNLKRRAGAKTAVATKRRRTMDMVTAAVEGVVVPIKPIRVLVEEAICSWEDRRTGSAGIRSDPSFLERITANYVRHELTAAYDDACSALFSQVGRDEAYYCLRFLIDEKIDDAYPDLLGDIQRMQAALTS
jgi:hypothetical protein